MGEQFWHSWARFTQGVNRLFLWLAGCFTAAILCVITYDLVARNVFDAPTLWALDMSRFLMVYACFLALAPTLEHGSHVAVDLVVQKLPSRWRHRFNLLALVLVIVFACLLLWQLTRSTIEAFQEDSLFPTVIEVKLKYVYWIAPLGVTQFLLTAIAMLQRALSGQTTAQSRLH